MNLFPLISSRSSFARLICFFRLRSDEALLHAQNLTGDVSNTVAVFLTSTYGQLADAWQHVNGLYNYALFFIGSQPHGAGTPFVPRKTAAVDWSPFSPNDKIPGGLDVATGWGPTQYGCCPKTVADPPLIANGDRKPRRVMLGWLQNGCSSRSSTGIQDSAENSLTLPRDLSLAADGTIRQHFVAELQQLRLGLPMTMQNVVFPRQSVRSLPIRGAQLEVKVRIKYSDGLSRFGLWVLAGQHHGTAEYTAIGFDLQRHQVFIDRRNSSANRTDTDVRAGPIPETLTNAGHLTFHAYVDHSIVTLIAENQTALTVFVHPIDGNSTALSLFHEGTGPAPTLTSLHIWRLANATLN